MNFFVPSIPHPLITTSSILCVFMFYEILKDFINETVKASVIVFKDTESDFGTVFTLNCNLWAQGVEVSVGKVMKCNMGVKYGGFKVAELVSDIYFTVSSISWYPGVGDSKLEKMNQCNMGLISQVFRVSEIVSDVHSTVSSKQFYIRMGEGGRSTANIWKRRIFVRNKELVILR